MKPFWNQHKIWLTILLVTWGVYFTTLFARIMKMTPQGLLVGHGNVWSDWAIHIALANIFAYKSPADWFAYHPIYAQGQLTYPFLVNLISGLLMRLGVPITPSFVLPSIILALLLLAGMYWLLVLLLKSGKQALMAITIFLLSSGPGFLIFLGEFWKNPKASSLFYPPLEYSKIEGFQWNTGNYIAGMLMPQRAFLLGMVLFVWVCGLVIAGLRNKNKQTQATQLFIAGLLAGILPIAHTHSFIVTVVITGLICVVLWRQWRELLWFVVPAGIISSVLYLAFLHGGIENPNFFSWRPGWTSEGGLLGWIGQWFLQWGLALPLGIWAYTLLPKDKIIQTFFAGFGVLFVLSNLWHFQPTPWDNSKIFLYVYFSLSALLAVLLAHLWLRSIGIKIMTVLIGFSLIATGILEDIRLQRIDKNSAILTPIEDIQLGEHVRNATPPNARFLTAADHNSFIMMWAVRPILMGYPGWVGNYGFLYEQTYEDMQTMYAGTADTLPLLAKYKIDYVVIGPNELNNIQANELFFASNFPVAFENINYRIYKVR